MKIAVVTDEGSSGGAGIAATRLCVGLRRRRIIVGRLHGWQSMPLPESADASYPMAFRPQWLGRLSEVIKIESWRRFTQARWIEVFRRTLQEIHPDVINLHNLHGAHWDIEVVEVCLCHAPVVWTLHDMWPFTGSCAYSFDCRKFETACDRECPQLGAYPTLPARAIHPAHQRRKRLFAQHPNLTMVCPSRWLVNEARKGTQGQMLPFQVPYGLDLKLFHPIGKSEARRAVRIPDDDKPNLLAAAATFETPRKGLHTLVAALKLLRSQPLRLILMGRGSEISLPSWIEVMTLGSVSGDSDLSRIYNASDLLIHPAHADNQPLVVMEALACGVPAVGLPVGGVPEMIRPDSSGWLARDETPEALAEALEQALFARNHWPEYAKRCRAQAEKEYALELQALRYEKLFEAILSKAAISQAALDAFESAT